MIPKECKRLAEVDFPIAVVSKHSAREKSIRHGHPSTLHLWWARRPLASCRAMLLGLLLPDPCDPHCPAEFKAKAAKALLNVPGWDNQQRREQVKSDEGLRRALLDFIGDVADWDVANNPRWIGPARELVKAAHPEETPLVVDPFAGGGSIPLEALRLGCEAFASDLNPVACLILKVMLEDIPRESRRRDAENAESLADELRRVGKEIKEKAEKELADFYPADPDGAKPIAYLWARTVRCESPNCGAEIPLMRSFWLCKKPNRRVALRPLRLGGEVSFEIFEPKNEKEVPGGTVSRAKATCLCCGAVLPPERVRAQLAAQRGGADVVFEPSPPPSPRGRGQSEGIPKRTGGARMLAVVTLHPGVQGRHYRLPTERDYEAVWKAQQRLKAILDEWEKEVAQASSLPANKGDKAGKIAGRMPALQNKVAQASSLPGKMADKMASKMASKMADKMADRMPALPLCPVPDEPLPPIGTLGFRVQRYGMLQWGDLFTARQKVSLVAFAYRINEINHVGLAIALSKMADLENSLCSWRASSQCVDHLFARQAIPIIWDFAEAAPLAGATGSSDSMIERSAVGTSSAYSNAVAGQVQQADACESPLPSDTVTIWFTDPPYYDAVPYADLSDFFFVWLKRTLPGHPLLRDPFNPENPLVPKAREAVQNERSLTEDGRSKDRDFYEEAMARAFAEGRRILREDGVGAVVFAHKTTEGWEALLSGMIRGGWTITGSWPIATEMASRLRARDSAALATSVHLVCRPRPEDAPVGDWAQVLRELPGRVGDWMERLQSEGVRGADLVFACIGPALEIFSRYRKVETADGREVSLPAFLEKVWEVVGRTALENVLGTPEAKARNGIAGALEEDARLTALFLWTLQSTNSNGASPQPRAVPKGGAEKEDLDEEAEDDEEEAEDARATKRPKGLTLIFDVVRRFAQPLGIHLPDWEGRIIETKKGVVRLLAVSERAKQLFGEDGAAAAADWIVHDPQKNLQQVLFPELEDSPQRRRGRRGKAKIIIDEESLRSPRLPAGQAGLGGEKEATTLDRVHAAMLLQAGGQANALRQLIRAEQQRGPDFLRLANALSALYPPGSDEKRLLDAMLLAVPR